MCGISTIITQPYEKVRMTFTLMKNTEHIRQYLQTKQKHPHNSEEYKKTMTKLLQRSGSPPYAGNT